MIPLATWPGRLLAVVAGPLVCASLGSSAAGPRCGHLSVEALGPPLSHYRAVVLTRAVEPCRVVVGLVDEARGGAFIEPLAVAAPWDEQVGSAGAFVTFRAGGALRRPTSFAVRVPGGMEGRAPEVVLTVRAADPGPAFF